MEFPQQRRSATPCALRSLAGDETIEALDPAVQEFRALGLVLRFMQLLFGEWRRSRSLVLNISSAPASRPISLVQPSPGTGVSNFWCMNRAAAAGA